MTVDETTTPGEQLRDLRERLGLTIRDVENASNRVAARHQSSEYSVSLSRLSDIETKGVIPSIFKLYSLSVIYRKDIRELLSLYGVDVENATDDIASVQPPRTHRLQALDDLNSVKMPVRLDPLFDLRTTDIVGRLIVKWGTVSLALLKQFELKRYSHAYIGTEDWTMYPLILPGSFVQIDESKTKVTKKLWRAEYQRPIYFVETREGFTCCWCELNGPILTLQPHPMSPSRTRTLRLGSEVEIVGQVVGIAMQLDAWTSYESEPAGTQSGE
jgi:transcriptional regulator with XRE-family HTH domain